jgi:hypothetical protein
VLGVAREHFGRAVPLIGYAVDEARLVTQDHTVHGLIARHIEEVTVSVQEQVQTTSFRLLPIKLSTEVFADVLPFLDILASEQADTVDRRFTYERALRDISLDLAILAFVLEEGSVLIAVLRVQRIVHATRSAKIWITFAISFETGAFALLRADLASARALAAFEAVFAGGIAAAALLAVIRQAVTYTRLAWTLMIARKEDACFTLRVWITVEGVFAEFGVCFRALGCWFGGLDGLPA